MNKELIILFDGECNFCNGTVKFVIKRDRRSIITFATLQSTAGQRLLNQYHLPPQNFDSFVFIEEGKAWQQSTAALKVCKYLTSAWPLAYGFIIVPKFFRDKLYNWIAKNRYKWFGRMDHCMVPSPELKSRFLVDSD